MSVIINTTAPALVDNTHYFFHVKFNLILQLIRGISSDLKKLLKYFNGTTTFTFNLDMPLGLPPAAGAGVITVSGLPNKLILYFKELEVSTVKSAIALASVVHLVYIDKA